MKQNVLSLFVACLLSFGATAQVVGVGPQLGFNASGYSFDNTVNTGLITKDRLGFRAGAIVDIMLNENFYLQPEGFYVMTGYRWLYPSKVPGTLKGVTYNVNTIQIPVNATWKFFHPNQSRLFLSAGPYVALNFGGTYNVDTVSSSGGELTSSYAITIGADATDPQINRFDFGFGVSGGYEYFNGLFLKIFYQQGLLDMSPSNGSVIPHATTYNYGFTLGYFLSE
jgi:hypothetical protein